MKHYTTPRLVAIDLTESDAVRTSGGGGNPVSEKGFGDIFAEVDSGDPGGNLN